MVARIETRSVKLKLEGLYKSFIVDGRKIPVLEEIELSVRKGEFVSVVGPSGCGKTTLLNCIAGLDHPDAGTVELDGSPVERRLGMVGVMPQKDLLLPWRTVLDNAILGLEVMGYTRSKAKERAVGLVEIFGLSGFERQYPSALSGGMRQRAAFLRTLLADQDLILLDEPLGALDAFTRSQMQEWLMSLWGSLGKTIVLITHDVEEAILLSDRVYVLTPRPAWVKLEVVVNLPRPRNYQMVTDKAFVRLKGILMRSLRGETAQS